MLVAESPKEANRLSSMLFAPLSPELDYDKRVINMSIYAIILTGVHVLYYLL